MNQQQNQSNVKCSQCLIFRKRSKSASTSQNIWKAGVWIFWWPGRFDPLCFQSFCFNVNFNGSVCLLILLVSTFTFTLYNFLLCLLILFASIFPFTSYHFSFSHISLHFGDSVSFKHCLLLLFQYHIPDRVNMTK